MKVIKPEIEEIVFHVPEGYRSIEAWLESVGRTCWKSEDRITENSADRFIEMICNRGHYSIIEHAIVSARIIADRGMATELIRHRIASFAQESSRYCNYSKGKFNGEITVIEQPGLEEGSDELFIWQSVMEGIEAAYMDLIDRGVKPEIARSVLPIGLKAEIVITANLREWGHIFNMRCDSAAHPIIRKCTLEILNKLNDRLPSIYKDQAEKFLD